MNVQVVLVLNVDLVVGVVHQQVMIFALVAIPQIYLIKVSPVLRVDADFVVLFEQLSTLLLLLVGGWMRCVTG